jgi:hypothetical protein
MSRPASTNSARPRQMAQVNPRLDKSLAAYIVAAGAAGVGMLALAVPAEGKIVYTPDNQQIPPGFVPTLLLDLNHDGINDFSFLNFFSATSSTLDLSVLPVGPSNEIFSTGAGYAAALPAGKKIGPNGKFRKTVGAGMANGFTGTCRGPWIDARGRYLGLKFIIKGEIHFGWARLNVRCVYPHAINATLTGYAYETVANQPIVAGDTKGPDESVDPGTLGNLARGSAAVPSRRDEPTTDETH